MKRLAWVVAPDATLADRWWASLWGEALRARDYDLSGEPSWFRRARPTPVLRFGWDRRPAAVRVASALPPPLGPWTNRDDRVVVPDDALAAALIARGFAPATVLVVPYPIPDAFLDASDGRSVFEVTARYHLEARPRLVAMGDWTHGQALTRLLPAARRAFGQGGELVLLDAVEHRAQVAPAAAAAGLQESVVMLPGLSVNEWAGLYRSADLFVAPDVALGYPFALRWALAAGLPVLALDDPLTRRAAGDGAAVVDPKRPDAWPGAVARLLSDGRWREELARRGVRQIAGATLSETVAALVPIVEGLGP